MEVMGGIGIRGGGVSGIGAAGWDPSEVKITMPVSLATTLQPLLLLLAIFRSLVVADDIFSQIGVHLSPGFGLVFAGE